MAEHLYMGACPDELQPDAHDPDCPGCLELAELRSAADLLARVRAGCRVSLTNNGFLRLHIDANDECSDLLRELAEALSDCGSSCDQSG